jgi:hypothetical protein
MCETTILMDGVLMTLLSSDFIFGSLSEEQWRSNNSNWADFRVIGMEVADNFENVGSRFGLILISIGD